jgi:hypothetical protein
MIDSKALEVATEAAFLALYPQEKWEDMPPTIQTTYRAMTTAAIEAYERATVKGYAEKIERKGLP